MRIISLAARPLLAGMFVYGGLDAFRNPAGKVPRAEKVAPDIAALVGIDADTEQLVGEAGVSRMEMRGREMDGWLRIAGDAVGDDAELARWIAVGTTYARSLPPKD